MIPPSSKVYDKVKPHATIVAVIVSSAMDEKRIISATWAKVEDIGRFLRQAPVVRTDHDCVT